MDGYLLPNKSPTMEGEKKKEKQNKTKRNHFHNWLGVFPEEAGVGLVMEE